MVIGYYRCAATYGLLPGASHAVNSDNNCFHVAGLVLQPSYCIKPDLALLMLCSFAAGLLLGAANAVGTDTDPLAVRAAEANAALNGLQDKFMVLRCGANLDDPEPLAEVGNIPP